LVSSLFLPFGGGHALLSLPFRSRKIPSLSVFLPGCPGASSGLCGFWFRKIQLLLQTTSQRGAQGQPLAPTPRSAAASKLPGWAGAEAAGKSPRNIRKGPGLALGLFPAPLCGAGASPHGRHQELPELVPEEKPQGTASQCDTRD